jgi:hypothetical protein
MPGLNGQEIAVVIQESRGFLPAKYPSDPSTAEQFGQILYEFVRLIGSERGWKLNSAAILWARVNSSSGVIAELGLWREEIQLDQFERGKNNQWRRILN